MHCMEIWDRDSCVEQSSFTRRVPGLQWLRSMERRTEHWKMGNEVGGDLPST